MLVVCIIQALFMTLPVVLAGLSFIFFLKKRLLKSFEQPLDFGTTFRGKRIFGRNKTWLGVLVMSTGTLFFSVVLTTLSNLLQLAIAIPSYTLRPEGLLKSLLLGAAYSLGELPNSFIKRQLNISEGAKAHKPSLRFTFSVLDVIDSVFAASLAAYLLYPVSICVPLVMFLIGLVVHLGTDFLMKRIGLK
jgi:CDP-diglyceride synthetase